MRIAVAIDEAFCFVYNENLRLQTMRYAMRDMIKKPPPDFEEVVKAHFRAVRPLLLRQCARWLEESTTRSPAEAAALRPLAALTAIAALRRGAALRRRPPVVVAVVRVPKPRYLSQGTSDS